MRRFTTLSGVPVATPRVPPPSLILRCAEPGPIGSVARFARASCPGSIAMRLQRAGLPPAAGARAAANASAAAALIAVYVERIDQEDVAGDGHMELDRPGGRRAAARVGDLVARRGRRLAGSCGDANARERVGGIGEPRELSVVLGDRLRAVHLRA